VRLSVNYYEPADKLGKTLKFTNEHKLISGIVTASQKMEIREAYSEWSATYDSDRNLTRDLDRAVVRQELVSQRCEKVLELGCGTGKNTNVLAATSDQVIALDFSAGMIAKAREKLTLPNVHFEIADITHKWPFAGSSFDLIACNLVLEHIEDLAFIFREAHRVLMTGGCFFVCELHPYRQYEGTQARFQRAQHTKTIPAFVHHISDFTGAAAASGLSLRKMNEWWHQEDQGKPPRLVSFTFAKPASVRPE
jgi:ubiquinone/menaquinone biosynthesis C-methylase UbiE